MPPFKFIAAVISALNLIPYLFLNAEDLTAVLCQARMPTVRSDIMGLYDGEDTVYLFGGFTNGFRITGALKYSISQDILEGAGTLPERISGSAVMDKVGNIYLLGSFDSSDIFQYFPDSRAFTKVGGLPSRRYDIATIKPDQDTALIFGGFSMADPKALLKLDLNTLQTEKIAELPDELELTNLCVVWVESKGVAYIFNGNIQSGFTNVTKFDRFTNTVQILPITFPTRWSNSQAVYDGKFAYIIGGVGEDSPPYDRIVKFDPETEHFELIRVEGYPGGGAVGFARTSAVYIEKLNRIYMFGGQLDGLGNGGRDQIWYISLDPLVPPTTITPPTTTTPVPTLDPEIFNCVGLGDSIHPFPGNCAKFIVCRDDHAYQFDCQEPFLFHPEELKCTWPDLVNCNI